MNPRLVLICLGALAAAAGAAAAADFPTGPGSLQGLWLNKDYPREGTYDPRKGVQLTIDGKRPPLLPEAARVLDQRVEEGVAGRPYATTKSKCLPAGVPQMDFPPPQPVQVLETPGQVTILYEEFDEFRPIPLNRPHEDDPDPSFMGDSVGHWEGDTLVVDTIALSDETTLDPVGMPHSDALHTVERFRRVAKDKLEVTVRIEDPKTFSAPWTARAVYTAMEPDYRLTEYLCRSNRNPVDEKGNFSITATPKGQ